MSASRAEAAARKRMRLGLGSEIDDAIAEIERTSPYSTLEIANLAAELQWDMPKVRAIVDEVAGMDMHVVMALLERTAGPGATR